MFNYRGPTNFRMPMNPQPNPLMGGAGLAANGSMMMPFRGAGFQPPMNPQGMGTALQPSPNYMNIMGRVLGNPGQMPQQSGLPDVSQMAARIGGIVPQPQQAIPSFVQQFAGRAPMMNPQGMNQQPGPQGLGMLGNAMLQGGWGGGGGGGRWWTGGLYR